MKSKKINAQEIIICALGVMLFATVMIALTSCSTNKKNISAYTEYAEQHSKYYTILLDELYNIAENNYDIIDSTISDTVEYHKLKRQIWDKFVINFDDLDLDDPLEYYLTNDPDLIIEKFMYIISHDYMKEKINPNVYLVCYNY